MSENKSFTYSFNSFKTPHEIFETLSNVPQWWFGLYDESINGDSKKLNDEFTFKAGGGVHYSKQKLVELIPDKKLSWLVTDSNLNFLNDSAEWTGTKIAFEISKENGDSKVTFTHEGLLPEIECYDSCSSAWAKYLQQLKQKLN